jgi:hypothetical protein
MHVELAAKTAWVALLVLLCLLLHAPLFTFMSVEVKTTFSTDVLGLAVVQQI